MNSADLSMFTGTENYHRFSLLFRRHVLTDGAKYLAENCGAYWLMDAEDGSMVMSIEEPEEAFRACLNGVA